MKTNRFFFPYDMRQMFFLLLSLQFLLLNLSFIFLVQCSVLMVEIGTCERHFVLLSLCVEFVWKFVHILLKSFTQYLNLLLNHLYFPLHKVLIFAIELVNQTKLGQKWRF